MGLLLFRIIMVVLTVGLLGYVAKEMVDAAKTFKD